MENVCYYYATYIYPYNAELIILEQSEVFFLACIQHTTQRRIL